jgi:hypothetical protein
MVLPMGKPEMADVVNFHFSRKRQHGYPEARDFSWFKTRIIPRVLKMSIRIKNLHFILL